MMRKTLISLWLAVSLFLGGCAVSLQPQSRSQITQNLATHYENKKAQELERELGELTDQQQQLSSALMYLAFGIAGDKEAISRFKERVLVIAQGADYIEYLIVNIRLALYEARYEDAKVLIDTAKGVQDASIQQLKAIIPEMQKYWNDQKQEKEGI